MNLDYSLIKVTAIVVECLKERGNQPPHNILSYARSENSEINEQDIMSAVSFLFLLGKAEYNSKEDQVYLSGEKLD